MQSFGQSLLELESCDSTNRLLLEEPQYRGRPEGFSLLARHQSAGRGRGGRSWESPQGGLYLSTLLRPSTTNSLTFLGAQSMLEGLRDDFGLPVELRWPNDLVLGGRKICGVLTQAVFRGAVPDRAVIGVGLNVDRCPTFPPPFSATSLREWYEAEPERDLVLESARAYLARLEANYRQYQTDGGAHLIEKAGRFLEGLSNGARGRVVDAQGTTLTVYSEIAGLGPDGEIRFKDGRSLRDLEPGQRFRPLT